MTVRMSAVFMAFAPIYMYALWGAQNQVLQGLTRTVQDTFADVSMPFFVTIESYLNETNVWDGTPVITLPHANAFDNEATTASRIESNPLNDQTLPWDSSLYRQWLDPSAPPPPPAMLLLTNFGWNHPNQTYGMLQYRGMRTLELVDGIINHPWFHPTAWEDIKEGRMEISNETRYYVFLDAESCGESNYPRYGHGKFVNRDTLHNRSIEGEIKNPLWEPIAMSRLLRETPHSQYILFECGGVGPTKFFQRIRKEWPLSKNKLSFVSLSTFNKMAEPWDQGLAPPACRKSTLTPKEERDIQECNETARPILISFSGQVTRSQTRRDLASLNNDADIVAGNTLHGMKFTKMQDPGEAFERLAKGSAFSAVSRGDCVFSYRFSEVMASGSIPVVYADDWKLPFGSSLIDWKDALVIIPENETLRTVEILSNISSDQRCSMRKKLVEFYRTYMETGRGIIQGIIQTYERNAASVVS